MTRSLENLFDEPQRRSKAEPSAAPSGDFDALMDEGDVDTKGVIDPSWDKVRAEDQAEVRLESTELPAGSTSGSGLEDEGLDDLMGMKPIGNPSGAANKRAGFPPEPALANEGDAQASFPWWVIVAAIVLILAGAAAVVTFS